MLALAFLNILELLPNKNTLCCSLLKTRDDSFVIIPLEKIIQYI